jgi:hypothetical protein
MKVSRRPFKISGRETNCSLDALDIPKTTRAVHGNKQAREYRAPGHESHLSRGSDHKPAARAKDRLGAKEPKNEGNEVSRFSHGCFLPQRLGDAERVQEVYFLHGLIVFVEPDRLHLPTPLGL